MMLTGCGAPGFHPLGTVQSSGGVLGQWSVTPWACVRGQQAGAGAILPGAVIALAWEDPSKLYIRWDLFRRYSPDTPVRLELWGSGPILQGRLRTMKHQGWIPLDQRNCTALQVVGRQSAPVVLGGLPRLDGRLILDCQVQDSHLTSTLQFQGCEP